MSLVAKVHEPTPAAVVRELLNRAHTEYYADDADCFIDYYDALPVHVAPASAPAPDAPQPAPAQADPARVIVIVHGGYWRQDIDVHRRLDVAKWLIDRGETVACVEYRRGAHGPWPQPLSDVRCAIAAIRARYPHAQLVALGHSVGGGLVLLSANDFDVVVALAPVTNAARVYNEGKGDDAAKVYFGEDATPNLLMSASPFYQPAVQVPCLIVHGAQDPEISLTHTLDYLQNPQHFGHVDAQILASCDHMDLVDPACEFWPSTWSWINTHTSAARS